MTQLDLLNQKMSRSCSCSLKSGAVNVVTGTGSPDAKIVFIGEAPGKQESLSGKPFIGASGKMLDALLHSIDVKRDDVYITNIVKYRPPDNRDPSQEEISACLPWLLAELEFIHPLLVVPLGRHALETFIPGQKISQVHGQMFDARNNTIGTNPIYAMYHPAAALYNGGLRKTLFDDIAKIPKIMTEIATQ